MAWVRVCRLDELSESAPRRVLVRRRALCLSLVGGAPQAVDDRCPHRDVALSGGLIRDGVITCPGHFRRFELRTGRCLSQAGERVATYECAVVDGWVEVDVAGAKPRLSIRQSLLARARGLPAAGRR